MEPTWTARELPRRDGALRTETAEDAFAELARLTEQLQRFSIAPGALSARADGRMTWVLEAIVFAGSTAYSVVEDVRTIQVVGRRV